MSQERSDKSDAEDTNLSRAIQVFEQHGDLILSVIRLKVSIESEVEDLFQHLFLSLVRKPIPNKQRHIETYVLMAAKELVKDNQKRKLTTAAQATQKAVDSAIKLQGKNTKKRLVSLSFLTPRKYREAIIGDILEDCKEQRELGRSEFRIRVYILWQLMIALATLWPATILSALRGKLRPKD